MLNNFFIELWWYKQNLFYNIMFGRSFEARKRMGSTYYDVLYCTLDMVLHHHNDHSFHLSMTFGYDKNAYSAISIVVTAAMLQNDYSINNRK